MPASRTLSIARRSFKYSFRVADQTEPNAFALPGGYIFISRGLLELVNSEDELACVIGHEIAHVAKRHAAARQGVARGQMPLVSPVLLQGRMAAYSRDLEQTADHDGQILCAAAGYDPRGMATLLQSLDRATRIERGYSSNASFFDTHPTSTRRHRQHPGQRAALEARPENRRPARRAFPTWSSARAASGICSPRRSTTGSAQTTSSRPGSW